MSTDSVSRAVNDDRARSGLPRRPVPFADQVPDDAHLRGPGLFEVVRSNGEAAITNIRRLAGTERAPGSALVTSAAILLGLLAAALFVVTLNAQYKYVFAAKQQQIPSMIEAASLDLGLVIFTLLALGLAMAGQSARIERALIVACAVGSAGQNYAAADVTSPRSVAAYVVPSLFLALVVDRVVAVVRRHVLGDDERSVWATISHAAAAAAKAFGLVLLYVLRFVLAPLSTGAGLRQLILDAAPVPAAAPRQVLPPDEVPAIEPPEVTEPPELAGASKKARLAWWYRQDPDYGNRAAVAAVAKRLALKVDLSEGTARAYLGQILAEPGEGGRGIMIRGFITRLIVWALVLAALCAVLFYEAVHNHFMILALFGAVVFVVLFYGAVLGRRAQARRRVRALRWRARLRLRPGPGYASLFELVFRWGRLAALHHGGRARPGLGFWRRVFLSCATAYAVRLGRAQYCRRVYARMEDQILVLAPQRTGKSGLIADQILSHPGPVLATSTRPDLYKITAGSRAQRGPIDVFNPQGVGGLPSTFGWDILAPCRDLVMARRIGGWLAGAILDGGGNLGNIEWFEKKGDVALACLLWAAAVSGHTITDVFNWAQLYGHEAAIQVLANHPDSTPQMLAVVKRMLADNRTAGAIRDTIELSLSWTIVPSLAAAVTPPPGQGFDLARFISQNGTLYLIASGDEDSPVTPLFSAFTSYVHYASGLMGTLSPAGRLDPPLRLALDEVTTICPVDLPTMLSDSAGKGILITAVAHGTSQLKERWGEHGGQTVWDTCGTKILLGGISDAETLRQASEMCGTVILGEPGEQPPVPVVPPEFIRALPDWRALVIRMNLFPVVVKIRPAWKRLGHRLRFVPAYDPRRVVTAADVPAWDDTMPLELPELAAEPHDGPSYAGSLTPSHLNGSGGED